MLSFGLKWFGQKKLMCFWGILSRCSTNFWMQETYTGASIKPHLTDTGGFLLGSTTRKGGSDTIISCRDAFLRRAKEFWIKQLQRRKLVPTLLFTWLKLIDLTSWSNYFAHAKHAGRMSNRGSIPGWCIRFLSSPYRPDWSWTHLASCTE
jgi:hypothetical protein